ncbi:MAG: ThiF family adenylyltransferase [Gammaproteobacteria bacterium]
MAQIASIGEPWRLVIPQAMFNRLHRHLFPGDGDEHGAVIAAGIARSARGVRLLARSLHLAEDGRDYVPGKRGYRMLKAQFIANRISECSAERLVYLAIHNHGGRDSVRFSGDDFRSHERGYPALLDIADGLPVGALVFAQNAVAGDIWLPGERRIVLAGADVVGASLRRLAAEPPPRPTQADPRYDRQARLFGDAGQHLLGRCKVGIIGLGGAGSLFAEYLARLGIGWFVLADPERAEGTNIPRLTGASYFDALSPCSDASAPAWLQMIARRFAKTKVSLARRNILRANPKARVEPIFGDFLEANVAAKFLDCDYLFLAADSMRARLLFNAIVYQYLIPGVQVGAKVRIDSASGDVLDVYSVVRPVTPDGGCLLCNRLINSAKLQEESISAEERRRQRYVDEPEVIAPSVMTLNATAVSQAANDFMMYMTGLRDPESPSAYMRFQPQLRAVSFDATRKSPTCIECATSSRSRLALGDARRLPVIERQEPFSRKFLAKA